MLNTKHNLSKFGPGPIRATNETRICVFCHTPHNGTPKSPLWNRELPDQTYPPLALYDSPTFTAGPASPPTGPTKLCLNCHDGIIALGAVVNPVGGIPMQPGSDHFAPGSLSDFGTNLASHHPVSFSYSAALPDDELVATPPFDLVFGGADELHCTTCHDPHNDAYGMFLLKDNRYSALCTTCHQMNGWSGSVHAESTVSMEGVLPLPPRPLPASWGWKTLAEWGCEACHTPHFAPTPAYLLNSAPFTCVSAGCHAPGTTPPFHPSTAPGAGVPSALGATPPVVRADIGAQVLKPSAHRQLPDQSPLALQRGRGLASRSGASAIACVDCHNPHVTNDRQAEAPYASGMLQGVPGVDRNGAEVRSATYEYEICFKCHGDNASDLEFVPRVVASTDTRADFDSANPSFHPVVAAGRALDVPSIPSSLSPTLTPASQIYCSSCHADDEGGSNGPHGSSFPPILRERYETGDGTPESYENYALCYRCHERRSLLADDSFRRRTLRGTPSGGGHSGHLAAGIPCSACHDPHGIDRNLAGSDTGDHTHLVNFDTRIVLPLGSATFPVYRDTGGHSGNCTLACHGVTHNATAYP